MSNATPRGSSGRNIIRNVPRAKKVPGWGARFVLVLERLRFSQAEVARRVGYSASQVGDWIANDTMPGAATLNTLLKSALVWDRDRALAWLSDGEGRKPGWLDTTLDPTTPPSGWAPPSDESPRENENVIAFPTAALDAYREALSELERDRKVGELRGPGAIRAWTALDRGRKSLPGLDSNQEKETQNFGIRRGGVTRGNNSTVQRLKVVG